MTVSNPSRHRRRYRYSVGHTVRRVRMNPAGSSGGTLALAGGAVGMGVVGAFLPKLTTKMIPASASPKTGVIVNAALTLGLGTIGMMALRRTNAALGQGILVGSIVSAAIDVIALIAPQTVTSPASAAAAQAATPSQGGSPAQGATGGQGGTGATGGQGGTGATGGQGNSPVAFGGTGGGTSPQGANVSGYLGRNMRRKRRLAAYLNGMNMRPRMGKFLSPGQPIQSLIGANNPSRRAFGSAGNLRGLVTGVGSGSAFRSDAWGRSRN